MATAEFETANGLYCVHGCKSGAWYHAVTSFKANDSYHKEDIEAALHLNFSAPMVTGEAKAKHFIHQANKLIETKGSPILAILKPYSAVADYMATSVFRHGTFFTAPAMMPDPSTFRLVQINFSADGSAGIGACVGVAQQEDAQDRSADQERRRHLEVRARVYGGRTMSAAKQASVVLPEGAVVRGVFGSLTDLPVQLEQLTPGSAGVFASAAIKSIGFYYIRPWARPSV
ncbi:hypothetical protein JKP88DRAFT_288764 [Tribonema minus]|uniref:Uncharacterized protein n=1 Tax=Tribonema minus TaxID=303371 RepID=A0A836CHA8_9STRA|nr:hypothetical protein JKP88DRAFT_288764 [Tribonema minus]